MIEQPPPLKLNLRDLMNLEYAKDVARSNFYDFCEYVYLKSLPNRVPAPHHPVLCSIIDDVIKNRHDEIHCFCMPPGSGKSLFLSTLLPAYLLGIQSHQQPQILCITNANSLSERFGKATRAIIQSREYKELFPDVAIVHGSSSATSWMTTQGGEMVSSSISSVVLGKRSSLLSIDDPISGFEEASSIVQLKKIHEIWETNLVTRPKSGTNILVICQRLSANDLVGYLERRAKSIPDGRRLVIHNFKMEWDGIGFDPMGRTEIGEQLWADYYTPAMLADAKSDDYRYKTLYQQMPPTSENEWCNPDNINFIPNPSTQEVRSDEYQLYGCGDMAWTQDSGDYTVLAVMAVHRKTGRQFIMDMFRKRVTDGDSVNALIELHLKWKPLSWLLDDDRATQNWTSLVHAKCSENKVTQPYFHFMPIGGKNKEIRAANLKHVIASGRFCIDTRTEWAGWTLAEFSIFPHGLGSGVDDIIDAIGLLSKKMVGLIAYDKPAQEVKEKPPEGHLPCSLNDLFEDNERGRSKNRL